MDLKNEFATEQQNSFDEVKIPMNKKASSLRNLMSAFLSTMLIIRLRLKAVKMSPTSALALLIPRLVMI